MSSASRKASPPGPMLANCARIAGSTPMLASTCGEHRQSVKVNAFTTDAPTPTSVYSPPQARHVPRVHVDSTAL